MTSAAQFAERAALFVVRNEQAIGWRECEASLRRLRVDVLDLYQIHWPDPDEDIEEGWAAMLKLKDAGSAQAVSGSAPA